MAQISFDELIAKRQQREADRLKVGTIPVPGTDKTLQVTRPTEAKMLELYGKFSMAISADPGALVQMCDEALYHSCAQLQDGKLREALGIRDPLDIVPALFSVPERNEMGGALLRFLGFIPEEDDGDAAPENPAKN